MSIGPDRKQAERALRQELAKADRGEFVGPERVTLNELLDPLEESYVRLQRRSLPQLRSRLKPLRAALGKRKADQLGTRAIEDYADARLDLGYQPATINRELEILRRAFKLGVEADPPRLSRVPTKITMLPADNARAGFLDHADYERLRDCLEEPVRLAFIIAYRVPSRISEILGLTWSQVDLAEDIVLPKPKQSSNKRVRGWPIYGDMKRALSEAALVAERDWPGVEWVIHRSGRRVVDYRGAWSRGTEAAGLSGLLVHDLRRSAARNMRLAGVPEVEIMKMAGWRTRSMFERCQIVDPKGVRRAGEQAEQWMERQDGARPELVN